MANEKELAVLTGKEIAVIGIAARFPGASNIDTFWDNLAKGVESITFFTDEELVEAGVERELLNHPDYVKAGGQLEDKACFDAAFFGYTPLEAELMSPQMRLFHECAWEAMEDAGYNPGTYERLIGLYAGSSSSTYWEGLSFMSGKCEEAGHFAASHLTDKDFVNAKVAYSLNLKGPVFSIHAACSSSLVAVHVAGRALLTGECKMALAGGSAVVAAPKQGYLYQEGMIASPDGHCRAFDAEARGTIGGEGVGLVVLKRLSNAVADGDSIYAVIKGSAINNDGCRKVGFSAPSIDAQAEVIRTALRIARIEPDTVGYIEAHGTGTLLGDPVEIAALKLAFDSEKTGYCAVGSVKSNIGHLDVAAGIAGFIKAVLALKHKQIPPSLHFNTPNPKIDFENSPFFVNAALRDWKRDGHSLRAGVSSLGIGGTNVHVVLEEAPERVRGTRSRKSQVILLSSRSERALEKASKNLADYLKENPGCDLADVAFTLQAGRSVFQHKQMVIGSTVDEVVEALSKPGSRDVERVSSPSATAARRPVVFMFSGLGAQYVNMGRELYQLEPQFREEMDRGFSILESLLNYDIKEHLYPSGGSGETGTLEDAEVIQPLMLIFEYSLAKLLIKWGITPAAMIGYSFGEYVAACIGGVFSLESALKLVVERGKLVKELPEGLMLSVPIPLDELQPLLDEYFPGEQLSVAIDNGPSNVVSGPPGVIEAFEKLMKEKRCICMRLPQTVRALHSKMMEPISEPFARRVGELALSEPKIPFISNVTGDWAENSGVTEPQYWAEHLRKTVRFADGLKELIKKAGTLFIEIGPGRDLTALAARFIEGNPGQHAINLIRPPHKEISDLYFLLNQVGRCWLHGIAIDWNGFYGDEKRNRLSLPTYPFEREHYWFEGDPFQSGFGLPVGGGQIGQTATGISDWFYLPQWKRSSLVAGDEDSRTTGACCLIFAGNGGLTSRIQRGLKDGGYEVIIVNEGVGFGKVSNDHYVINPADENDYKRLFEQLRRLDRFPGRIIHLWNGVADDGGSGGEEWADGILDRGFYSLVYVARAIGENSFNHEVRLMVVTSNIHEVTGEEALCPVKSTILGPAKVIPQEFPYIRCRSIDIVVPAEGTPGEERLAVQLVKECNDWGADTVVAYRGRYRWIQTFEPVHLETPAAGIPRLKERGVYLITGGLGNIGLTLSRYLAQTYKARLILTGRSPLPPREQWAERLSVQGKETKDDALCSKIRRVLELEKCGAEVLTFAVDVADVDGMRDVAARSEDHFGPLNGVIHAAGDTSESLLNPIGQLEKERCRRQFGPKINGLQALAEVLRDKEPDFCLLTSSLSPILGGLGFSAYAAANTFLDVFAHDMNRRGNVSWISVNWADWELDPEQAASPAVKTNGPQLSMSHEEGIETFRRILCHCEAGQVTVSSWDLEARLAKWIKLETIGEEAQAGNGAETRTSVSLERPNLMNPYVPPVSVVEKGLAAIWKNLLGFSEVGITDDFIELGGDSLKAITAISRTHKELGTDIPIAVFFETPTIKALADYIANRGQQVTYKAIEVSEKKEYYSLSPAQKRWNILQQLNADGTSFNETIAMWLVGDLDARRLENAFQHMIQRHEVFRSSIRLIGDEAFQVVHSADEVDFRLAHYKRSGDDVKDLVSSIIRPFDYNRIPLIAGSLIGVEDRRHLLVVDMPHIVTDGASMAIFLEELIALYQGLPLPSLEIQYKDYAEWENRLTGSEEREKQERFWLELFEGEIPVLELPTDYNRPAIKSIDGKELKFEVGRDETAALKKLAAEEDVTVFMILLAVFNLFLSKMSGQEDIVVGVPIAGRRHADLEKVMGIFLNTLALRNRPVGSKSFRDFLHEVRNLTLKAFENQDYQFEDLMEKTGCKRDASRSPMFDVVMNFLNSDGKLSEAVREDSDGLAVIPFGEEEKKYSDHDLTLFYSDGGECLFFSFEYCTQLFNEDTIAEFINYFKEILGIVLEAPGIKLEDIHVSHSLIASEPDLLVEEDLGDFDF